MDEENVLVFLTSLEAMDPPDRIEEVNARILSNIVEETDYVAVLFCKCDHMSTKYPKRQTFKVMKALRDQNSVCVFDYSYITLLCVPCKVMSVS
jgi:hypothetical protein